MSTKPDVSRVSTKLHNLSNLPTAIPGSRYVLIEDEPESPSALTKVGPASLPSAVELKEMKEQKEEKKETVKPLDLKQVLNAIHPADRAKLGTKLALGGWKSNPKMQFRVRLGRCDPITASTGLIDRQVKTSLISASTDRTAIGTLFDEIFIVAMHVHYVPYTRYTPVYGVPGSANQTPAVPLGLAICQHGSAAYTTLDDMSQNNSFRLVSSDTEWRMTWRNEEDPKPGINADPDPTSSRARQGWSAIGSTNLLAYTGFIQILSPTTPYTLSASYVIGLMDVQFDCLVRSRS